MRELAPTVQARARSRGRAGCGQRGSAIIEMALVLPVFFLFCWGFMVLSFVLMGYGNATYASKMAARYAVMHGNTSPSPFTTAQLKAIAYQYLWGAPSATSTFVVIQTNGMNIGSAVNVGITVVYPTGIPFSSLSSVTIGASTTEVILE